MPHPKGNLKLSGDIHLPDAESDLALEEGRTGLGMLAHQRTEHGRPGGRTRKAGLLADEGAPDAADAPGLRYGTEGEPGAPWQAPPARAVAAPARRHRSYFDLGVVLAAGLLFYKLLRR